MSQNEVIIDEHALTEVADSLITYSSEFNSMLAESIRKIQANSSDWNDEDFTRLLSAINSFMADAEYIEAKTKQFTEKINRRIESIHELHSIKFEG